MSTVLKKIQAEAKRIRKKSPRTSYQSALKQAGAKYRKTAKKAAPKKAAAKKTSKKRVTGYDSLYGSKQVIGAVRPTMATMKKTVLEQIGKLEAQKFAARLKRDKTAISKKIAEKKRLYKKLS